jgi:hypothetical protein
VSKKFKNISTKFISSIAKVLGLFFSGISTIFFILTLVSQSFDEPSSRFPLILLPIFLCLGITGFLLFKAKPIQEGSQSVFGVKFKL